MSRKIRGMVPPKIQESKKFDVNRKGQIEAIWQPLYDYIDLAGNTTDQLDSVYTFFALPVGQGGKTYADTNMESAAALPAPKEMLVTHIEVVFIPATDPSAVTSDVNWDEANLLMKNGFLDFFIGSKSYLKDAPVGKFSNSFRLGGVTGSVAATAEAAVNYATFTGALYEITPIKLVSNQNFNVTLNFPNPVTPILDGGRLGVILGGFLYRLSQ